MPRWILSLFSWQQKPVVSHAQQETWFTNAENQRKEVFGASLQEYWRRFADEEKAQWEGEKQRDDTFDQMIVRLDECFETAAKEQDKAFWDEEAKRSNIFQVSEALRETRFSEAERDRGVGFLKDQETREKRMEWYVKIRESRFQTGRQEREEICRKLEKDMREQLERLLRWQEECFASAEKQRDEVVREIVTKGQFPHKTESEATPNNIRLSTSEIDCKHASSYISRKSQSRSRSRSRSRSLSRPATQLHDPRETPDSSVGSHHPMTQLMPMHDQFRPSVSSLPGPPPVMSSSPAVDVFETRFIINQEQRQHVFLEEEEQRNKIFSEAEAARNEAEASRSNTFEQREVDLDEKFKTMMLMHRTSFEESELSRRSREDWRVQAFQVAEEDRTQTFRQTLLLIKKQYYTLDALEVDVMQSMKRKVEKMNVVLFEQAKQQRNTAFSIAQVRRELELSVPPWKQEDDGEIVVDRQRRKSEFIRKTYSSRSRSRTPERTYSPPRCRRYMSLRRVSPVRRRYRPLPPATGFHPGTLLHAVKLRGKLPVPGDDQHTDKPSSSGFPMLPRRRQHIFDQSQAERDEIFENGIQERRHTFSMNETQRGSVFQQLQRTRMKTFQYEQERSMEFMKAEASRQAMFRDAEGQRESDFRDAERLRAMRYRVARAGRDAKYCAVQSGLQDECFESDRQRTSSLEEWASNVLRDEEEEVIHDYKAEEIKYEKRFARAIEASARQRAAEAQAQ